jgi:ketosteroid isomerase-like protein
MGASTSQFPDGRSQQAALDAHVAAENVHDLDALVATFAPDGVMVFNGVAFADPMSIRAGHEALGFGGHGALSGLKVVEDRRSFTNDGIVVEGHLTGRHVAAFGPLEATNQDVALPYCVVYQFNTDGQLVSERAYVDTSPLSTRS